MRSAVYTVFRERSDFRDVGIEPIDSQDDNPDNFEPGRFILDRFASSVVNKGYRERSKVTIQKYIFAKNVIKN